MSDVILTADPNFIGFAWREFSDIAAQPRKRLTPSEGVIVASCKGRFPAIAERLRQSKPAFLRHICPADHAVSLTGELTDDLAALRKLVRDELAEELVTGESFSVQTRIIGVKVPYKPFDINKPLSDEVIRQSGATLDVRDPLQIVSCTITVLDQQIVALVGISQAQHNLSNWAGGERRYKREAERVSRAEFKLLEAFEWWGLKPSAGGTALDLGAAPGGWTRVLRQLETPLNVVAVDPGDLHPSLMADSGVEHVRKTAEIYLLNVDPDQEFALIVNDMRLDARRSADAMNDFAPYLAKDGFGIMTVKLPQHNPLNRLDATVKILRKGYNIVGVKQLFHNRNEVTVLLSR